MSTEDQLRELRLRVEPLFMQSAFAAENLPEFRDEELPFVPFVVVAIVVDRTGAAPAAGDANRERASEVLAALTLLIQERHEFWEKEWCRSPEYHHMMHGGWDGHPNPRPEISRGRGNTRVALAQAAAAAKALAEGSSELHHLLASDDTFASWLQLSGMQRLT